MKTYRDIPYIVHVGPVGAFCAYIRIPDEHPWNHLVDKVSTFQLTKDSPVREIHNGYNDIDLDVHGGLTFSNRVLEGGEKYPQGFTPGAWIGWDYAHAGDAVPGISYLGDHYYDHAEVSRHCEDAIDLMLEVK